MVLKSCSVVVKVCGSDSVLFIFMDGITSFFSDCAIFWGCCINFLLLYVLLLTYSCSIFLKGPETLLRQSSKLAGRPDRFEGDSGDTVEAHQWKCVHTMAGIFPVINIHYFVAYY